MKDRQFYICLRTSLDVNPSLYFPMSSLHSTHHLPKIDLKFTKYWSIWSNHSTCSFAVFFSSCTSFSIVFMHASIIQLACPLPNCMHKSSHGTEDRFDNKLTEWGSKTNQFRIQNQGLKYRPTHRHVVPCRWGVSTQHCPVSVVSVRAKCRFMSCHKLAYPVHNWYA